MKRISVMATACVLAVLALLAPHVTAQQTNVSERTYLTFSSAVEMPGVTLEPGTYEFRIANTQTTRNVVQVLRKDQGEVLGQFTFVQSSRPQVSGETVVLFREAREGTTPAIQYWYFPGEKIGKEFVYPKDQAERIAARTGQTVQSEEGAVEVASAPERAAERAESTAAAAGARASDAAASAESAGRRAADDVADKADATADAAADTVRRDAPAASQPSSAAGSTAGNRGVTAESEADARARADASAAQTPAPAQQARGDADRDAVGTTGSARADAQADAAPQQQARATELPRTASPLALSGLVGLLSLAGAFGVRAIRR